MKRVLALLLGVALLTQGTAHAHGEGTDRYGCHAGRE